MNTEQLKRDHWWYEGFADSIRWLSDDALESELMFVIREVVEARVVGDEWALGYYQAKMAACQSEKERRELLAKYGAPQYRGRDLVGRNRVEEIKQHFVNEQFVSLFEEATGMEVLYGYYPGAGLRWKYRCTLHGDGVDRNPSGMLYGTEGRFWCFVCNEGGDVFDLLMRWPPHMSFTEAVEYLELRMNPYVKDGKRWTRRNDAIPRRDTRRNRQAHRIYREAGQGTSESHGNKTGDARKGKDKGGRQA